MIKEMCILIIAVLITVSIIPMSVALYEYYYIERDYVFSRGMFMPSNYLCETGVLYKHREGAIFNKDGSVVDCITISMIPAERSK